MAADMAVLIDGRLDGADRWSATALFSSANLTTWAVMAVPMLLPLCSNFTSRPIYHIFAESEKSMQAPSLLRRR